eukprot:1538197-Rhodomonas_salina.4
MAVDMESQGRMCERGSDTRGAGAVARLCPVGNGGGAASAVGARGRRPRGPARGEAAGRGVPNA